MKPKWPEWARFRAMDDNGDWYFYENEPVLDCGVWTANGRLVRDWEAQRLEPILERRP